MDFDRYLKKFQKCVDGVVVLLYPLVLTVYPDVRTQIVVLDIPQECVTQYLYFFALHYRSNGPKHLICLGHLIPISIIEKACNANSFSAAHIPSIPVSRYVRLHTFENFQDNSLAPATTIIKMNHVLNRGASLFTRV